jgi:hypothetical protein
LPTGERHWQCTRKIKKMNKKIYVVGGTHIQAMDWIKNHAGKRFASGDTSVSLSDYIIIDSVNSLRGKRNVHGFFVGDWRKRPDILELIEALILSEENYVNLRLEKLHEEIRKERHGRTI